MAVTEPEVLRQIQRLEVIYGPAKGDRIEVVGAWRSVMESVSAASLMAAVTRYVKSDARYFPRPGMVRSIAAEIEADTYGYRPAEASRDWNQNQDGPCPCCGAVLQELTPEQMGQHEVFDCRADKTITFAALKELGVALPKKRFGLLHDFAAHKRAGVDIVGYHNGPC